MELMLTVTSSHRISLGNNYQTIVESDVYSIGRGLDNSWVLDDPKLHVSGKHCVIHKRNNEYHLTDISTNGVFVNGDDEPVGRGRSVVLKNSDHLKIGEYEIKVRLEGEALARSNSDIDNLISGSDSPYPKPEETLHNELLPDAMGAEASISNNDDVITELLGNKVDTSVQEDMYGDHVAPEKGHFLPPEMSSSGVGSNNIETESPEAVPPTSANNQPIPDNWLTKTDIVDQTSINVPEELVHNSVTRSAEQGVDFTPQPTVTEAELPLEQALQSEDKILSQQTLPVFEEESITKSVSKKSKTNQSVSAEDSGIMSVIFSAAGMTYEPQGKDEREVASIIGKLLGGYTQGMVEALATRNMVKSEFRLQQTMIRPVDNNPLKFSPSGSEALKTMLFSDSHAYLPADSAISSGFFDIQAHQLSMMSGIQAAFSSLLDRFDPEKLEFKFAGRGKAANSILSRKRVNNWEEYKGFYQDICKLMEDEFQDLFTSEFGRAYEEQLRKLKSEKGI